MKADETRKKNTPYYHVSWADANWEEIPALSREWLTAHETSEYMDEWFNARSQVSRNRVCGFNLLALAVFLTVEVHDHE
jgi:hypothetical protein